MVATYNDACNTIPGVAVLLEVFRYCDENAGRQCHVEDSVLRLLALLELLHVLVEGDERFVLVILTRDVRADLGEAV